MNRISCPILYILPIPVCFSGFLSASIDKLISPRVQTVNFLSSLDAEAKRRKDDTVRQASVLALGAVVRTLNRIGESERARKIHAPIREELEQTMRRQETGERRDGTAVLEQVSLLRALGNAARPEDAELIAKFATDDVVEVRDQAAFSLRNIDTPKARVTLFALAQDQSTTVATTALRAMRTHSMTKENWTEIRTLVGEKKIPKTADASLVELIRAQRRVAGADGDAILRDVIVRAGGGDPTLRDSAQQLLNMGK